MNPHFGLARRPFRLAPDPAAYAPTPPHEAAATTLGRAFRHGHGVALVDGEPGTGKTLAGVRFLDSLPTDTPRVMLAAPRQAKPAELFQALLFDLGRPYQGLTEHELRLSVTGELLAAAETDRRMVVFLDEAHHLTPDAVEELRLLGNLESPSGPAVFVLLAGLPAVRSLVAGNPSLSHRLAARCRLVPLTVGESEVYLREQVRACGGRAEWVFVDEAVSLIAELAGGVPRALNRLAGLAMALAEEDGADAVDAEAVLAAAEQLELTVPNAEPEPVAGIDEPESLPHPNQVPRPPRRGNPAKRKAA